MEDDHTALNSNRGESVSCCQLYHHFCVEIVSRTNEDFCMLCSKVAEDKRYGLFAPDILRTAIYAEMESQI